MGFYQNCSVLFESFAQRYTHKFEQFVNLYLVTFRLVSVFCKGLVCIFVCFCVSLDHFGFVLLVLLGSVFHYRSKRLAGKNVSKMTYFLCKWDVKPYCISISNCC